MIQETRSGAPGNRTPLLIYGIFRRSNHYLYTIDLFWN